MNIENSIHAAFEQEKVRRALLLRARPRRWGWLAWAHGVCRPTKCAEARLSGRTLCSCIPTLPLPQADFELGMSQTVADAVESAVADALLDRTFDVRANVSTTACFRLCAGGGWVPVEQQQAAAAGALPLLTAAPPPPALPPRPPPPPA